MVYLNPFKPYLLRNVNTNLCYALKSKIKIFENFLFRYNSPIIRYKFIIGIFLGWLNFPGNRERGGNIILKSDPKKEKPDPSESGRKYDYARKSLIKLKFIYTLHRTARTD